MSNVQTLNNHDFFTPILLVVSPSTDQKRITEQFIEEQFSKKGVSDANYQLRWLNQELETIPIQVIRDLIIELAYAGPLGKARIFVLQYTDQLSLPAQHAFLKSLEEPPAGTQLLLVTAHPHKLLPTLLSRCVLHQWQANDAHELTQQELPELLEKFLFTKTQPQYGQLIELAATYKDRAQAIALINQILLQLHFRKEKITTTQLILTQKELLKTLQKLQANANVQLTLENCFFTIRQ